MSTTGKVETHPNKIFLANPKYLRLKTSDDHVQTLFEVLKDAKPGDWPFVDPIHAIAIPASQENLIKEGYRYYIIDGHHRCMAAAQAERDIKAIIHSALSDADCIAMQVSLNAKNSLALNHAARTRAVRELAIAYADKGRGLQKEIARITNLPNYTVSRILSDTKPPVADTPADGRKGPGKGGRKAKPFDPEKWEDRLYKVIEEWGTHRRKILKIKGFPDGLEKGLDSVVDCIMQKEEE